MKWKNNSLESSLRPCCRDMNQFKKVAQIIQVWPMWDHQAEITWQTPDGNFHTELNYLCPFCGQRFGFDKKG
jgi:hypothetical protein